MSEEQLGHENSYWDVDQSWAFPNSITEDKVANKSTEPSNDKQAKGKKRGLGKESDGDDREKINVGGDQSDDHELHIWTERERRKRMRNMFGNLHSLLPHLPSKTDKSSIIDEAVSHIKKLEQTLKTLQEQKLERALHGVKVNNITNDHVIVPSTELVIQSREAFLADHHGSTSNNIPNPKSYVPAIFKTWTSANVILNTCGNDAQISICSTRKPGLLTKICFVIEKNRLEVLSAHVSSDTYQCMYMIHARANGGSELQANGGSELQAFTVEEIYKQAAAEIMLWLNS